ncbi:MAG: hypothetical protein IKW85_11360 [Muribaculaceae bacterium]|nr:hypothetical protein [Muribaculaceae bacterium]
MKKCPQCERSLPDDARQCIFCGEKFDTLPSSTESTHLYKSSGPVLYKGAPQHTQQRTSYPAVSSQPKQSKSSNKSLILYGLIAMFTSLLIGVVTVWFLSLRNQSEVASTETPAAEQVADNHEAPAETPPVKKPKATKQESQSQITDMIAKKASSYSEDPSGCYIGRVVVTGTNVRLRSTPQINNYNILKDRHGMNLHPRKGEVLPCIDIAEDFYYVDFHGTTCYISSQFTNFID